MVGIGACSVLSKYMPEVSQSDHQPQKQAGTKHHFSGF